MRGDGAGWRAFATATLLVLLVSLTGGCGPSRSHASGGEPEEPTALDERLRDQAAELARAPYQVLRYNPTGDACPCPPFEVRLGERWWRVRLEGEAEEGPSVAELEAQAALALARGELGHYYAVGSLDEDPIVACRNGAYGFEMTVDSWSPTPPPPVDTDE